jgi:hypothetical protein
MTSSEPSRLLQTYRGLPEHLSSPPVFSGVHVTRFLVLYVCFVDRCLSFCTLSFGHCVVCSSSIYGFWLVSSNSSYTVVVNYYLVRPTVALYVTHFGVTTQFCSFRCRITRVLVNLSHVQFVPIFCQFVPTVIYQCG